MFEFFKDNYSWNMAINIALGMGAAMGEIADASRDLHAVAPDRDDDAAEKFFAAWTALGSSLRHRAKAEETAGRLFSAGEKYRRAFIYMIQAERMQRPDFAPRKQAFADAIACFGRYLECSGSTCRRVEVPYKDTALPALFVPAETTAPAPCMVHFDGLDVTKEIIFLMGMPAALARRGIATLVVDNPGVGQSLRERGLTNFPEAEVPASACVDFLEGEPQVIPDRIGMMALSLGGYHAPRAAAFEKRFACCVAWGANYDWGKTQRARYENREASLPVPHYWDHVGWVFGKKTPEEIVEVSERMSLAGVLDRIACPILCVHGENDRQITLAQAEQLIAECVNSPRAELHVHRLQDGGAEHCSVDNVSLTVDVMADWIAEVLGGRTART